MHSSETVSATEHILALRNYPRKPAYIPAALEDVFVRFGSIPEASEAVIRNYFGVQDLPIQQMEPLFHSIDLQQQVVKVCEGPLCVQAGSNQLADELAALAGICIERQHCMGVCHATPAVKIGDTVIAEASVVKVRQQLDRPATQS